MNVDKAKQYRGEAIHLLREAQQRGLLADASSQKKRIMWLEKFIFRRSREEVRESAGWNGDVPSAADEPTVLEEGAP